MNQMLTSSNILIISFGWQQHLSWCETGRYQNSLLSGTFWWSISLSHYQHHDHWLIILINQLEPWPTSWSWAPLPWPPRFGGGRQCRQCQSKSDRASWNTPLGIECDTQMKHMASKHIENGKKHCSEKEIIDICKTQIWNKSGKTLLSRIDKTHQSQD